MIFIAVRRRHVAVVIGYATLAENIGRRLGTPGVATPQVASVAVIILRYAAWSLATSLPLAAIDGLRAPVSDTSLPLIAEERHVSYSIR